MPVATAGPRALRCGGPHHVLARLLIGVAALQAGCGHHGPPPAPPPPKVSVVTLQTQAVPITTELPGRVNAMRTADVRPQVSGVILKRLFVEGERGQGRPAALSDRSGALQGRLRQRRGGGSFGSGARGALQAPGRSQCGQQTGLRQCRCLASAGAGRGGDGAHQPDLYAGAVADLRTYRTLLDHRRRAGHCQSVRGAGHRTAA